MALSISWSPYNNQINISRCVSEWVIKLYSWNGIQYLLYIQYVGKCNYRFGRCTLNRWLSPLYCLFVCIRVCVCVCLCDLLYRNYKGGVKPMHVSLLSYLCFEKSIDRVPSPLANVVVYLLIQRFCVLSFYFSFVFCVALNENVI